jgi:hypothetical protein
LALSDVSDRTNSDSLDRIATIHLLVLAGAAGWGDRATGLPAASRAKARAHHPHPADLP